MLSVLLPVVFHVFIHEMILPIFEGLYTELNNTAVVGGNAAFYPRLSILAKKYLAIPVSYVPSERVFSLAGQ
jgi:hypothetical protein